MLGAVAGDIIGSPYKWNNTDDRYFDLGHSTRGWFRGREVSFHPRFTGDTVMTMAVARWIMDDKERRTSELIRIIRDMARDYPDREFSPMMRRWFEGDRQQPFNSYGNGCAVRLSPAALVAESLSDAINLARQTAGITHAHPDGIKGAEAMAQAVWMARHGREKDDIRFAMEHDFGYNLSQKEEDIRPILQGCAKEPIVVNGEETGQFYYRPTGKMNSSCQDTVPAALMAFMRGDCFEDVIRRAVAMGGDSSAIAAMAGSIAEPFYGGVPEKIRGICDSLLDPKLRSLMETYERVMIRKEVRTGKIDRGIDDSFGMLRMPGGESVYIVSGYRKDIINALKEKFGENIIVVSPGKLGTWIREHCPEETREGTFLQRPKPDYRTIFYKGGKFHSPTTYPYKDGADESLRMKMFSDFNRMKDYAREVKAKLQESAGYFGEGSIHFATAYFPVISHSSIEVWKGDTFAGSIGISPLTGLLTIKDGGDLGPHEWGEDRCFSVFYGTSLDSVREALGHWCLDEGVGQGDKSLFQNLDRAFDDMSKCVDPALETEIPKTQNSKTVKIQ